MTLADKLRRTSNLSPSHADARDEHASGSSRFLARRTRASRIAFTGGTMDRTTRWTRTLMATTAIATLAVTTTATAQRSATRRTTSSGGSRQVSIEPRTTGLMLGVQTIAAP